MPPVSLRCGSQMDVPAPPPRLLLMTFVLSAPVSSTSSDASWVRSGVFVLPCLACFACPPGPFSFSQMTGFPPPSDWLVFLHRYTPHCLLEASVDKCLAVSITMPAVNNNILKYMLWTTYEQYILKCQESRL